MLRGFQLSGYQHLPGGAYAATLAAFREFSRAWLRVQSERGLWHQLLDDNTTYPCTSSTGFALYSLVFGVRHGALSLAEFGPAIERAWSALSSAIQPDGSVDSLSPGFGIL